MFPVSSNARLGQYHPTYQQSVMYYNNPLMLPTAGQSWMQQATSPAYYPNQNGQNNFYVQHPPVGTYNPNQRPVMQTPSNTQIPTNTNNFTKESFYRIGTEILNKYDKNSASQKAHQLIQQFERYYTQTSFKKTLTSKNYANIVLILGKFAHEGLISPQACNNFISDLSTSFTQQLERSDRPTQHIANVVYGLGLLSQRGTVVQTNLSPLVPAFIQQLEHSDKPTQEIANLVYGLGLLSQRGTTVQTDLSPLVPAFTQRLINDSRATQAISNVVYGLGLLSQRGTVVQTDLSPLISAFTQHIVSDTRPTQAIANVIYGLGLLSQRGTTVPVDLPSIVSAFTQQLKSSDKPTQEITNLIYGLGLLSQRGTMVQVDLSPLVSFFIQQQEHSDRATRDIANLVYWLGLLSQRGTVVQTDLSPLVSAFTQHIVGDVKPTHVIANMVYGLGLLSQQGITMQADLSPLLNKFFHQLIYTTETKKSIACLWAGLDLLKKSHQISAELYNSYYFTIESILAQRAQDDEYEFDELDMQITQFLSELNSNTQQPRPRKPLVSVSALSLFAHPASGDCNGQAQKLHETNSPDGQSSQTSSP